MAEINDKKANVKHQATVKKARARRFAMQAAYQHLLTEENFAEINKQFKQREDIEQFDTYFFDDILDGLSEFKANFERQLEPLLDRKINSLDIVERSILLVGAYELNNGATPPAVAINEAIILAKKFAGEDSHKYINGVLDKLKKVIQDNQ